MSEKLIVNIPIPRELSLLDTICQFRWGKEEERDLLSNRFCGHYSFTPSGGRLIRLDPGQADRELSNSFIHELLEYSLAVTGHGLDENKEIIVIALAHCLNSLLEQCGIRFSKWEPKAREKE